MILKQCILTNSTCYKGSKKSKKTGIVVHSTGANNKYIKRYVQPLETDDNYEEVIADIGRNGNRNDWNHITRQAGVHAFIGLNAKGVVETYQTLPYELCAWGVGAGKKGSYNYAPQARIQFEICEDGLTDKDYFDRVMKEAQEYCAYLCKEFGFTGKDICSHHESYLAGYGGNHGDCDNWLKKFGKDMDWFRGEVDKLLNPIPEIKIEPVAAQKVLKTGSKVAIKPGAVYYSGKAIPTWVKKTEWIVHSVVGKRAVINKSADGKYAIMAAINSNYLIILE